ncbi:lysozyme [Methylomonas koyamae]|uniref:lysozyme n=1 Tax=Methylomonas koyamae TaxID=702114 RepID=UPI00112C6375|nr:lysozyme [Methylomonas koyamae]TPQ27882.1 muraminidase [Methylomonas koyamae]
MRNKAIVKAARQPASDRAQPNRCSPAKPQPFARPELRRTAIAKTLLPCALISCLAACTTLTQEWAEDEEKITAGIFLEPDERAVLPPGMELRPIYDKGLDLTKFMEGFRSLPYHDVAYFCTIGYGHLIKQARCNGTEPAEFRNGISEPRGGELLVSDMERAQIAVLTKTKVPLTDGQYAALCDFVYNVGTGNFAKSSLLSVVNKQQFDRVPAQFRRWSKANGRVIKGLKIRNEKRIDLFFDGIGVPRAVPEAEAELPEIDIRLGETGR